MQLGWSYGGGQPELIRPHVYIVQRVGAFLVLHHADSCVVGSWGNITHKPLGCIQDKRPGGIVMIPSAAFLREGEVYLRGEPILLQGSPKEDSQREERTCWVY